MGLYNPHSPEEWKPLVPPAEKMRGLEAEDVWTLEQIIQMKSIKASSNGSITSTNVDNVGYQMNDADHAASFARKAPSKSSIDNIHTIHVYSDIMSGDTQKSNLVREWVSVSKHLDDDYLVMAVREAQHRARISLFLEEIERSENKPMKYDVSPRHLSLMDFIQTEWISKGFNPEKIDRRMLFDYDNKLVRAIENYEYNNGLLPENFRFPKAGNKKSKKEMTAAPSPQ